MAVEQWVKDLTEDAFGPSNPLRIGKLYRHPETGRAVRITSGQYWGEFGLSNFWHWVDEETGEKGHGYGWDADPMEDS